MCVVPQYIELNACLDCDRNDAAGCASGLHCGINNCGEFHEISEATGINDNSDCCTDHFIGDNCKYVAPSS